MVFNNRVFKSSLAQSVRRSNHVQYRRGGVVLIGMKISNGGWGGQCAECMWKERGGFGAHDVIQQVGVLLGSRAVLTVDMT